MSRRFVSEPLNSQFRVPGQWFALALSIGVVFSSCVGSLVPEVTGPGASPPTGSGAGPPEEPGPVPTAFNGPISITVTSVGFRPPDDPEDAAVAYKLTFTNATEAPATVTLDQRKITAVDDGANQLEDYWAQAEGNFGDCSETGASMPSNFRPLNFSRLVNLSLTLAPGDSTERTLYLNPVDAAGDCSRNGRARARLASEATAIELSLPEISYAEGADSITGVKLRLTP